MLLKNTQAVQRSNSLPADWTPVRTQSPQPTSLNSRFAATPLPTRDRSGRSASPIPMQGRQPLPLLRREGAQSPAAKGSEADWLARTVSFLQTQMAGLFEQRHLEPLMPLFGHPVDFSRPKVAAQQNIEVAMQSFQASLVKMDSSGAAGQNFVAAPRDLMMYTKKDGGLGLKEAEFNGAGYGGRTNADPFSQAVLWDSTAESVSKHFKPGDTPLIVVSASGMEDADDPKPNAMLHEHMTNALVIAKGLEGKLNAEVRTCTLADITSGKVDLNDKVPTVVFDYTTRFLAAMQASNKKITLGGRPVSGIVDDPAYARNVAVSGVFNDRLTGCLKVKHGGNLEFLSFNSTDAIGQSKSNSHAMFNAFTQAQGAQYSLFREPIHYKDVDVRGVYGSKKGKEAVLPVVKQFLSEGRDCILKPSNAGNGKGITFIDLKPDGKAPSDKEIKDQINGMWSEIDRFYKDGSGKYSAGETITVEETLKLTTVRNPRDGLDPQNGKTFDLRAPIIQAKGEILLKHLGDPKFSEHLEPGFKDRIDPNAYYLFSIPTVAKVNAGTTRVNNITASTVSAAPDASKNLLALQNDRNLEKIGLTRADNLQIAQWNTAQAKFAIEQLDAHGGNMPPLAEANTRRKSGWSAGRMVKSTGRMVKSAGRMVKTAARQLERTFTPASGKASTRPVFASTPARSTPSGASLPVNPWNEPGHLSQASSAPSPSSTSSASSARPASTDQTLDQAIDRALGQALGQAFGQALGQAFSDATRQAGEQVKAQLMSKLEIRMQALDPDLQKLAAQLQHAVIQWARGLQPGGGTPTM